jgi:branched-chain amino acid transport system substrate-binding protein
VFVVGHLCSGSSIPASAVYHEGNVIMMSPAATAPAMTDEPAKKGWKNVFRVTGRDDTQGGLAGALIAKRYADGKIALIHDKSAYGKGLADEARKAMARAGVKEALYDSVTAGEKDFSALISRLKRDGIDVVYYGGYHTEAAQIVRQAHDQGLKAQFIGADALTTTELWSIAGNTAEGLLFTFIADPRNSPGAADTITRFRAAGYEPEGYTLTAYAAVEALAGAAKLAGAVGFDPLQAALRKGTFDTVLGPIAFDGKGDMKDPRFVFYRWTAGKYTEATDLR